MKNIQILTPGKHWMRLLVGAGLMLVWGGAWAQSATLDLRQLLDYATQHHPRLQASRIAVSAAGQDIDAAKDQRWPRLSVIAESGSDHNKLFSQNGTLSVQQTLWDGGRVASNIGFAEASAQSARTQVAVQQWSLALQIIDTWQELLVAVGRLDVGQLTADKLQKLAASMHRRVNTGASPSIDLELVQSRILQNDVEMTDAKSAYDTALAKLEQLVGIGQLGQSDTGLSLLLPTAEQYRTARAQFAEIDWDEVARHSPMVKSARVDVELAEQRLQIKRAERWPEIYARVNQSYGSNDGMSDTSASIGVQYTPSAGFSNLTEASAMATRVMAAQQGIDAAARELQQQMSVERQVFLSGAPRIISMTSSVEGARKVLGSYERQFLAGRKSWQELMNAERDLAQAQISLSDTRARTAGAMYRLQLRTGVLIREPVVEAQ